MGLGTTDIDLSSWGSSSWQPEPKQRKGPSGWPRLSSGYKAREEAGTNLSSVEMGVSGKQSLLSYGNLLQDWGLGLYGKGVPSLSTGLRETFKAIQKKLTLLSWT